MRTSIVVIAIASLAGCAHKGQSSSSSVTPAKAERPSLDAGLPGSPLSAKLAPKSGNTTLSGHATFSQEPDGVKVVLHVEGAPPGEHGAHIHETGDCGDPEAKNAGGHWNPAGHQHGAPSVTTAHLGDLGNIKIGEDGTGHLELTSAGWKLGGGSPEDLTGKAVVIHGGPDDLVSDPAGNSGPRIGCGVIH